MNDGIGRRVGFECCIALFIVYVGSGVEKMKVADVGVEAVVGLVRGGRGSDVMAVLYF